MSQREILDALEEELSVGTKPQKFVISDIHREGPNSVRLTLDPKFVTFRGYLWSDEFSLQMRVLIAQFGRTR